MFAAKMEENTLVQVRVRAEAWQPRRTVVSISDTLQMWATEGLAAYVAVIRKRGTAVSKDFGV